jgi:deoxycytidylate deaminase
MPHCNHDCDCGYPGEGGLLFEGKHLSNCASLPEACVSVHAEANAIAFAARHGVALEGATLYTTYSPCVSCAQLIINSGITKVVYLNDYRLTNGRKLLEQVGIETHQM